MKGSRLIKMVMLVSLMGIEADRALASAEADSVIRKSRELMDAKKPAEAKAFIEQYLKAHPDDADIHRQHAFLDNETGDFASVVKYATKALDLTGGGKSLLHVQQVFIVRAYAYGQLGRKTAAFADIESARKINPKNGECFHIRGELHRKFDNLQAAFADYEKGGLLNDCTNISCMQHAMCAATELKREDRRLFWIDKVLAADPNNDSALANAYNYHALHGDMRKAIEYARRYRDRGIGDQLGASRFICEGLMQLNDNRAAREEVEYALKKFPDDVYLLERQALVEFRLENYAHSLVLYQRLAKKNPKEVKYVEGMAMCYRKQSRIEEAVEQFKKASKIKEPGLEALLLRADTYRMAEMYRESAADFAKMYSLTSQRYNIVDSAQCWLSMGEYKRALTTMAIALDKRNPGPPLTKAKLEQLHSMQAQCYFRMCDYERARECASMAIASAPRCLTALIWRAQANSKLHRVDDAIVDLTNAIKVNPTIAMLYKERASLYELKKEAELAKKDRDKFTRLSKSLESDVFPSSTKK